MSSLMYKTIVSAVVVGLLSAPAALASSGKAVHNGKCCCPAVCGEKSEAAVADKTKVPASTEKTPAKVKSDASAPEKSAKTTTSTRSFSYEPDTSYRVPVTRSYSSGRSYRSNSGSGWNSGFSHDRAMAAKGYSSR
jgi:hypothetical protein